MSEFRQEGMVVMNCKDTNHEIKKAFWFMQRRGLIALLLFIMFWVGSDLNAQSFWDDTVDVFSDLYSEGNELWEEYVDPVVEEISPVWDNEGVRLIEEIFVEQPFNPTAPGDWALEVLVNFIENPKQEIDFLGQQLEYLSEYDITDLPVDLLKETGMRILDPVSHVLHTGNATIVKMVNAFDNKTPKKLNEVQKAYLRPFFGDLVDRVLVHYDAFKLNAHAQTFGYDLYLGEKQFGRVDTGRPIEGENEGIDQYMDQIRLLAHELAHTWQYEKLSHSEDYNLLTNQAFAYHYGRDFMEAWLEKPGMRNPYEDINLEQQARAQAFMVVRALIKDAFLAATGRDINTLPVPDGGYELHFLELEKDADGIDIFVNRTFQSNSLLDYYCFIAKGYMRYGEGGAFIRSAKPKKTWRQGQITQNLGPFKKDGELLYYTRIAGFDDVLRHMTHLDYTIPGFLEPLQTLFPDINIQKALSHYPIPGEAIKVATPISPDDEPTEISITKRFKVLKIQYAGVELTPELLESIQVVIIPVSNVGDDGIAVANEDMGVLTPAGVIELGDNEVTTIIDGAANKTTFLINGQEVAAIEESSNIFRMALYLPSLEGKQIPEGLDLRLVELQSVARPAILSSTDVSRFYTQYKETANTVSESSRYNLEENIALACPQNGQSQSLARVLHLGPGQEFEWNGVGVLIVHRYTELVTITSDDPDVPSRKLYMRPGFSVSIVRDGHTGILEAVGHNTIGIEKDVSKLVHKFDKMNQGEKLIVRTSPKDENGNSPMGPIMIEVIPPSTTNDPEPNDTIGSAVTLPAVLPADDAPVLLRCGTGRLQYNRDRMDYWNLPVEQDSLLHIKLDLTTNHWGDLADTRRTGILEIYNEEQELILNPAAEAVGADSWKPGRKIALDNIPLSKGTYYIQVSPLARAYRLTTYLRPIGLNLQEVEPNDPLDLAKYESTPVDNLLPLNGEWVTGVLGLYNPSPVDQFSLNERDLYDSWNFNLPSLGMLSLRSKLSEGLSLRSDQRGIVSWDNGHVGDFWDKDEETGEAWLGPMIMEAGDYQLRIGRSLDFPGERLVWGTYEYAANFVSYHDALDTDSITWVIPEPTPFRNMGMPVTGAPGDIQSRIVKEGNSAIESSPPEVIFWSGKPVIPAAIMEAVVKGPGRLNFQWKQHGSRDTRFQLWVDQKRVIQISGETEWKEESIPLTSDQEVRLSWLFWGEHEADRAWLDQFSFEPGLTLDLEAFGGNVSVSPQLKTYPEGTEVTINAIEKSGVIFTSWGRDVSGMENPFVIELDAPLNISAIFGDASHQDLFDSDDLTLEFTSGKAWSKSTDVSIDGSAWRSAQMNFQGITQAFANVTGPGRVSFWRKVATESPDNQYSFGIFNATTKYQQKEKLSGDYPWTKVSYVIGEGEHQLIWDLWQDSRLSRGTENAVWIDQLKVEPLDSERNYALEIVSDLGGSVSTDPENLSELLENSSVSLSAEADDVYQFVGWGGDVQTSANPIEIRMDGNKRIEAYFDRLPSKPEIVTPPISLVLELEEKAHFNVIATGSGVLTYQWLKNGQDIVGATFSEYEIQSVQKSDEGMYLVSVVNDLGMVTSQEVLLKVNVPPSATKHSLITSSTGGSINSQPLLDAYPWGTEVVLEAVPDQGQVFVRWSGDAQGSENPLTVLMDVDKSIQAIFEEKLNAPEILVQPVSRKVLERSSVSFHVTATGSSPLIYEWSKNGITIPDETESSITMSSVSASDAGNYSVKVSNRAGFVQSVGALFDVVSVPDNQGVFAIRHLLDGLPLDRPITVSITVEPNSDAIAYATQDKPPGGWSVSNIGEGGMYDAVNGLVKWGPFFDNFSRVLSYELSPNGSAAGEKSFQGIISIRGTNIAIEQANDSIPTLRPPTILLHPASIEINAGESATFAVVAEGKAPLQYQWQFNGMDVASANASKYTLENAQAEQAGEYVVIVSNEAGSVRSNGAQLIVQTPVEPLHVTIDSIQVLTDGGVRLNFSANKENIVFEIQASRDLVQWVSLGNITIDSGDANYVDATASLATTRFYRLKEVSGE